MNREQKLRQFQLDLDACCGTSPKPPRRLTGIEKAAINVDPMDLIDEEYKDVFSRKGELEEGLK